MSLSSLQCTTSDLKFKLYAFRFTQASWALRRAAVGSSDRGIKAVTNGAEQSKHKYGSTARSRLYISEASRHTRGRMVTSHFSRMRVASSGSEVPWKPPQQSKNKDYANAANSESPPPLPPTRMTVLLPMSVRLPRRSWGVFHNERHPAGSGVKAHGLWVSCLGLFSAQEECAAGFDPNASGIYTPVSATAAHRACQWHQMANFRCLCGRRFFSKQQQLESFVFTR